jgi:LacI family transcriptional regulator
MRDVAHKAGVSIRTVSRAIHEQGEITEETRQRVLAAVKELGYRPSKLARALVTRHTQTIGLVVIEITNPYFPEFARGVMDTAGAEGYNVFVCNSDGDPDKGIAALESLADHGVDGIIAFPGYENELEVRAFAEIQAPLVAVNRPFEQPRRIGQVLTRLEQGTKLATNHLIDRGHTAIGMIAGLGHTQLQRGQGFRDALTSHHLPVAEEWILAGPPVVEHGLDATRHLLTEHPRVTAIVCYNDLVAMGALQACKEIGRRVPDDCAIVGFDNIEFASMTEPSLTTIHVDKYWLGQQAATLLLKIIADPESAFPPVYADVTLVVRAST